MFGSFGIGSLGRKRKVKSQKRVKQGKALAAKMQRKARTAFNKDKAFWKKWATAWCKKKHKNTQRKSKKTGKMYNYTVYAKFRDAVKKELASKKLKGDYTKTGVRLSQILWKEYCGEYHADKKKSSTTKGQVRKTARRAYEPKKKSTTSKKKAVTSGPAFKKAGAQLKKLRPKVKLSGKSYSTLAKRKAAIAKAKKK